MAAASEPRKSRMSWCVSAASGAAASIRRKKRRARLRPVAGINSNVAFGEIAGPEASAAFAAAAHLKLDGALGEVELLLQIVLRERRRQAAPADQYILQANVDLAGVESYARIAGGRDDAAPVGVASGDRGFHEGRIGNAARDGGSGVIAGGAGNVYGYQFSRAFAIFRDHAGERLHHLRHAGFEGRELVGIDSHA